MFTMRRGSIPPSLRSRLSGPQNDLCCPVVRTRCLPPVGKEVWSAPLPTKPHTSCSCLQQQHVRCQQPTANFTSTSQPDGWSVLAARLRIRGSRCRDQGCLHSSDGSRCCNPQFSALNLAQRGTLTQAPSRALTVDTPPRLQRASHKLTYHQAPNAAKAFPSTTAQGAQPSYRLLWCPSLRYSGSDPRLLPLLPPATGMLDCVRAVQHLRSGIASKVRARATETGRDWEQACAAHSLAYCGKAPRNGTGLGPGFHGGCSWVAALGCALR